MDDLGAWPRPGLGPASSYSIKREFSNATVLITGASGYIGSVVLEQLLRTTDVAAVYLLLRPRRGQSIQQRADALLQGALFHKVRERSSLLNKVRVVAGDISLPGLGLSAADRATLVSSVNFIVHCAADIRLEADIQETLTANYEGTRTVLELAAAAVSLSGLVHVSSAFVNINQPRGSVIDEAVYPLRLGKQVVDVEAIAKELMESPKVEANQRAETYKHLWNFPNTYTLGKHMGEQLVTRYQAQLQLPVAIVRPSLTTAIAGEPYPGYVGNWAGPIGAAAAMAVGMFDRLSSVASQPTGVWDLVPADLVASSILAAAAAVSAGTAAVVSQVTRAGEVKGSPQEQKVVLGHPHPLSVSAQCPCLRTKVDVTAKIQYKPSLQCKAGLNSYPQRDQLSDSEDATSSSSSNHSPKLLVGEAYEPANSTDSSAISRASSFGEEGAATDAAAGAPRPHAKQQGQQVSSVPLLVVHAASSSTYPLVLMEGWNYMLEFLEAHPPPFKMAWGKLQPMTIDFQPNVADVMSARRRIGWKIWALTKLLRLMGREKQARKLEVGFDAWCVHNSAKTDRQLVFSTNALVALEAALNPAEAADYLLVWRPMTNRGQSTTNPESAAAKQRNGSSGAKKAKTGAAAAAAASPVTCSTLGHAAAAMAPVGGDITWRRYLNTQMAGVYRAVFGIDLPQRQLNPSAAAAAAAAAASEGQQLSDEHYILHDFVRIK